MDVPLLSLRRKERIDFNFFCLRITFRTLLKFIYLREKSLKVTLGLASLKSEFVRIVEKTGIRTWDLVGAVQFVFH